MNDSQLLEAIYNEVSGIKQRLDDLENELVQIKMSAVFSEVEK